MPALERAPVGSDLFQTFTARDLEGAPLVPAEAREELLALKAGTTFLCARPDGDIPAPVRIDIAEQRARVSWEVSLPPGEAVALMITVDPAYGDFDSEASGMEQAGGRLEQAHLDWKGACARITTDTCWPPSRA